MEGAMLLRALGVVVVGAVGMAALALVFGILSVFGLRIQDERLILLSLPMGGVAWVAAHDKTGSVELLPEAIKLFGFLGTLILLVNFGNWILVLGLVAVYVAVHAKPFLSGWNYIFVRLPIERQALKQQTLSAKLDADAELADATLRFERARAALADAEEAVDEAERRTKAQRS
jgi:hypothetical protein